MPKQIKVSVVLTSYNHADFIGKSIQSILDQTFKDFELLIVDDCSSDNSWEVINSFEDDRVIPIRHEKNLGGVIFPDLVDQLKGEYFAIAHCDDMWEKTKLLKQVKYLDSHPECGACFTRVQLIDEDDNPFQSNHIYQGIFDVENRSRFEWLRFFLFNGNALCHPSVLLRLQAQKKYELYAHGMGSLPDLYRWVKLCLHDDIHIWNEQLTYFRIRKNEINTSGDNVQNVVRLPFEKYVLDQEYYNIKDKDTLLKVFPEAKRYVVDGKVNCAYAIARIFADAKMPKAEIMCGLEKLYNLLCEPESAKEIEKLYGFNGRSLAQLNMELDPFSSLSPSNSDTMSLFIDCGNGFDEVNVVRKKVYIQNNNCFNVTFESELIKKAKRVRFDPCEGRYKSYKKLTFRNKGEILDYEAIGLNKCFNDSIHFYTTDPQFYINDLKSNPLAITITGEVKELSFAEINDVLKEGLEFKEVKKTRAWKVTHFLRNLRHGFKG